MRSGAQRAPVHPLRLRPHFQGGRLGDGDGRFCEDDWERIKLKRIGDVDSQWYVHDVTQWSKCGLFKLVACRFSFAVDTIIVRQRHRLSTTCIKQLLSYLSGKMSVWATDTELNWNRGVARIFF